MDRGWRFGEEVEEMVVAVVFGRRIGRGGDGVRERFFVLVYLERCFIMIVYCLMEYKIKIYFVVNIFIEGK